MALVACSALRLARYQSDKSLDEAAAAAGVSASLLSRAERGYAKLRPAIVAKLEECYGVRGLFVARLEPGKGVAR